MLCNGIGVVYLILGVSFAHQVINYLIVGTLKPRYNEPQYSEFGDIVSKTQLPF